MKLINYLLITILVTSCGIINSENKKGTEDTSVEYSIRNDNTETPEKSNYESDKKVLIQRLKEGGYIVYIRHTSTEKDYADQIDPNMDLKDCETQRKLSLKGVKEAHAIGIGIKENHIPIGEVITSEYCRAWKTANL